MLQYLLDTDHLTLYERGNAIVMAHVDAEPPDVVGISAVTAEEALRGRLAVLARARDSQSRIRGYAGFLGTMKLLTEFVVVPFDQLCDGEFVRLLAQHIRVGTQDLKIAVTALAHGLTVVTRNHRDFRRVPGLQLVDWSI